jgi:ribosomal protein S12 methylthiotransferase
LSSKKRKTDTNDNYHRTAEPLRVAMISLGCPKNLVDSEKMLAGLAEAGCVVTPQPADADVVLVNTCGFLQAARDEAMGILAELKQLKDADPTKRIVVAGCLVQRDDLSLLHAAPYIDAIVGVHGRANVTQTILDVSGRARSQASGTVAMPAFDPAAAWSDRGRLRLTPRHYAYLRISEGCDQRCTFCTIPSIRGPFRSKRPDEVLAEAIELAADGAKELVLIGQDTTGYGKDIGYVGGLAGLLRELDTVPGVHWLRLMYTYPRQFNDDLIDAIAACPHVVKYVDMPLQHIADRVLRRRGRRTDRSTVEQLLGKLRDRVPGIAIRTTLIAGFPGETDAEVDELLAFVQQQRFDAMGVFAYSQEPGTPAAGLDGQVADPVKQERVERLMLAQQAIALEVARRTKGQAFEVVIDSPGDQDGWYRARHSRQGPEVDSVTLVQSAAPLLAGDVLQVRCTGSREYDLLAKPVQPERRRPGPVRRKG